MKVAILAGGEGTRLVEETVKKPKAMVELGMRPIIWHIMMHYSHYGFNEFVIALGYKGESITRWMKESCNFDRNIIIKTPTSETVVHATNDLRQPDWTINLVETGQKTQTGGRIKRLAPWLDDQTFMLTWCDGLSDVNLEALLKFHLSHGQLATLTAVQPPSRFGHLILNGNSVMRFKEKPKASGYWINGAFFVLEPEIFDYIDDDNTHWEKEPLERLANDNQLMAYRHKGFWQCMDTLPEKMFLEKMLSENRAPWKLWKDNLCDSITRVIS
ncbi:MAG: glucose-1-phosphate cytidylyltransferase [Candidatus Bathyarchaeum sp.]|nr:MAG: glucose-1-phosphate cytidylyltransferase [Candidatus Bathyarchaeum sp.]